jgi:hypothetical protein
MSIPASVQATLDDHNRLVDIYDHNLNTYNSSLASAQRAFNSDANEAWSNYSNAQYNLSVINEVTPQIQALESKIPDLLATYGDQYREGTAIAKVTSTAAPWQSPPKASSQTSSHSVAFVVLAFAAYFFYFRRAFS